ncbi:MAG: MFS transporter [Actinomycetota bacterium]|nr:MFS transporter [Actinomycetota bacterium]
MNRIRARLQTSLGALREIARDPALRRLQGAWAASITAEWLYLIGLAVYAYDVGGTAAVGLVAVVRMIPAALAAPFVASVADRVRRERVLASVEVVRALLLAAMGLAVWTDAPAAVVFALASLVAVVSTAYRPAHAAVLPALAPSLEALTAANVSTSTIEAFGTLVGPAVAGVLLAVANGATVFLVTAGVYVVGALLVSGIRTDPPPAAERTKAAAEKDHALDGFRALRDERHPRLLVTMFAAQTLVRGSLNVLIVVAAINLLDIGAPGVGYLTSAIGVGGLIGSVVTLSLVGRSRLAVPFGLGIVVWGLPIAVIGLWPRPVVAVLALTVLGVGNSIVDVAGLTLLQRTVPQRVLARVLGVLEGLIMGAVGVGALVAPLLTHNFGVATALVATGLLLPLVVLLGLRGLRSLDARASAPGEGFGLLRGVPFLAPLPLPTLEHLAAELLPVAVEPSGCVMREGDPGDRFYVVREGELRVSAGGHEIATVGRGGYVGEIALLRDVPRTATVTAVGAASLYALERDEFLAAVTGHTSSSTAADSAMLMRLQSLGLAR